MLNLIISVDQKVVRQLLAALQAIYEILRLFIADALIYTDLVLFNCLLMFPYGNV